MSLLTLAVVLSSDVTGDACLQLAQYGDEVQSLQQQMEQEIEELKQTQQHSVTALKAEHVAEVKDIKHRLQTVNKLVHVIVPEVTALKTQYYELREQCRHLPEICRTTVEQTSRQVGAHNHGTLLLFCCQTHTSDARRWMLASLSSSGAGFVCCRSLMVSLASTSTTRNYCRNTERKWLYERSITTSWLS